MVDPDAVQKSWLNADLVPQLDRTDQFGRHSRGGTGAIGGGPLGDLAHHEYPKPVEARVAKLVGTSAKSLVEGVVGVLDHEDARGATMRSARPLWRRSGIRKDR